MCSDCDSYLRIPLVAQVQHGPGKVPPIRRYNTSVLNSNQPGPFHGYIFVNVKQYNTGNIVLLPLLTHLIDTDPVPRSGHHSIGQGVPARNCGVWRIWWRNIVENDLRVRWGLHYNGGRLFLRSVIHPGVYGGHSHLLKPQKIILVKRLFMLGFSVELFFHFHLGRNEIKQKRLDWQQQARFVWLCYIVM